MRYPAIAIRMFRKRRRLTATALATLAGISERQLWNLENDKQQPRADTLSRLAKALDVPIEKFFKRSA